MWTQAASIRRAWMDGAEMKVLIEVEQNSGAVWRSMTITGLAVDYKTLLVYWTDSKRNEIFQCDLDGNNRRALNLSPRGSIDNIFAVLDNTLFWQDGGRVGYRPGLLYRTNLMNQTTQPVLNVKPPLLLDLEILPAPNNNGFQDSMLPNPCYNNSCSHICVRSSESHEPYTCLCPDGYALRIDRRRCSGKFCQPCPFHRHIRTFPLFFRNLHVF